MNKGFLETDGKQMFHVHFCDGTHLNSHQHKSSNKTIGISQDKLGCQFWLFCSDSGIPLELSKWIKNSTYLPLLVDSHPLKPLGFDRTLAGNSGMSVPQVMRVTQVTLTGEVLSTVCVLLTCEFFRSQLVKENKWDKLICSVVLGLVGLEYLSIILLLAFFYWPRSWIWAQ